MPHEFEAQDGDVRTTAFPQIIRANGTNIPVSGYSFDAAAEEALFFRFRASDYVSGNVLVELDWYPDTATIASNVMWGVQLSAITPGDLIDIETDALAAITTVTSPIVVGAQRLTRSVITILAANLESLAPNDQVVLRVARIAANAADTMPGDAILTYVFISA